MSVNIGSFHDPTVFERSKTAFRQIERKGVSKAKTLEDLRDTAGKSFKTEDLERLMQKYDPEAYARYGRISKGADGARTPSGLHFLSKWIDGVKRGFEDGSEASAGAGNIARTKSGSIKNAGEGTREKRTAADEFVYLSQKYEGYSFLGKNYTYGMRYGSSSTTNVAISPQFLEKMANDPALEAEYEKNIAAMRDCDEQFRKMQAARGWKVEAQGWAIDKNGGISSWTVVTKDDRSSYLRTSAESTEKIRKQNAERREEKAKLEEKRRAAQEEKEAVMEKFRIMAQRIASGEFEAARKDGGLDTKA